MRTRKPVFVSLLAGLLLVASQAVPVSAAHTRFGAKLNHTDEPTGTRSCGTGSGDCTWVMNATEDPNPLSAPKNGTINKIMLVAGLPGHFKLQIARVNASLQAKVVKGGPKITYAGTDDIETFSVRFTVKKGDRLAIKAESTDIARCNQGSPHTLIFNPALASGGPFETRDDDNGCWLMLEAQYQ